MSIGSITSTPYVNSSSTGPRTPGITVNGQTFGDEQIKQFVQANQGNSQVLAQQASAMGLSAEQIQQALSIGGMDIEIAEIRNYALQNGYEFDAKAHGLAVAPLNSASIDTSKNAWSPTQNRWITPTEVKAFLDTNPSDRQILQKSSDLGLDSQDLGVMLHGQGYTGIALGQHYNRLRYNLYSGGLGYSTDNGNGSFEGKIVAGGGHREVPGKPNLVGVAGNAFGSTGIVGQDYNGTNNWSVKDGVIGQGTGIAGDGFGKTTVALNTKSTIQTASPADMAVLAQTKNAMAYSASSANEVVGNLLATEA
jgi:hypothetical protein